MDVAFTPIGFTAPKPASAFKASRDASHYLQYLQDKGTSRDASRNLQYLQDKGWYEASRLVFSVSPMPRLRAVQGDRKVESLLRGLFTAAVARDEQPYHVAGNFNPV